MKLPAIVYREREKRYSMTIPARYMRNGKRKALYGHSEAEVQLKYIMINVSFPFSETCVCTGALDISYI